jgi:hypothetical protein
LSPDEDGLESIGPDDAELTEYLYQNHPDEAQRRQFMESDLSLARVFEDVIDILIERGVFTFQDLPEAAQQKLRARRGLRKEFAYVENLFGADEDEFFDGDDDSFT